MLTIFLSLLIGNVAQGQGAVIGSTEEGPTTLYPPDGCPVDWIQSPGGCYLFYYSKASTWDEAQDLCEGVGGFLAEPRTKEKAEMLASLAFIEHGIFGKEAWWIGLTDQSHEGRWDWVHSMTDLTYSDWAPSSPQPAPNTADCAVMKYSDDFHWSDIECLHVMAAPICQRENTRILNTTTQRTTTTNRHYHIELRGGEINSDYASGNLFAVNHNGYLGPVCSDSWNITHSDIVCRQLGYKYSAPTKDSAFGPVIEDFAMDDVVCSESDEYLQDCYYSTDEDCEYNQGAGVVCSNTNLNPSTPRTTTTSEHYHIELRGGYVGYNYASGNVYVKNHANYLGPVCDDIWNTTESDIVCHQLGYQYSVPTKGSAFGSVPSQFAMDDVLCSNSEKYIQDCMYTTEEDCDSFEGAGVICSNGDNTPTTPGTTTTSFSYHVELVGGHITQDYASGNILAMNSNKIIGPVCDDGWGLQQADVVCAQLGYKHSVPTIGSAFGTVSASFAMDNVQCDSSDTRLQDCTYTTSEDCDAHEGAGVVCSNLDPTPTPGTSTTSRNFHIELRGGDINPGIDASGNVYIVNKDDYLGPVCDDNWADAMAAIACRQLGYKYSRRTRESYFGAVPDEMAMDGISCSSSSLQHIQDCSYSTTDDCGTEEGAGVFCSNIDSSP